MDNDAPRPPENNRAESCSSRRDVSRIPSLTGGLLGLAALSLFAGGACPLALRLLVELVPPPITPFLGLVVTALFLVPFLALAFTCWSAPIVWHGAVLVRLLVCCLLVSATLSAAAVAQWTVNTFSSNQFLHVVSVEMLPGVAAVVLGMAIVGAVQQLWFGWSLCEWGVETPQIPATSIRQLLEITAAAGVVFACFAAWFPDAAAVLPYLIVTLCGTFIGAGTWLRLNALSPRLATRHRSRLLVIALAFAGWYALAARNLYKNEGFWRFYDWRIVLIAATSTVLFLLFSGLPLIWLRRRGWTLLKRGAPPRSPAE